MLSFCCPLPVRAHAATFSSGSHKIIFHKCGAEGHTHPNCPKLKSSLNVTQGLHAHPCAAHVLSLASSTSSTSSYMTTLGLDHPFIIVGMIAHQVLHDFHHHWESSLGTGPVYSVWSCDYRTIDHPAQLGIQVYPGSHFASYLITTMAPVDMQEQLVPFPPACWDQFSICWLKCTNLFSHDMWVFGPYPAPYKHWTHSLLLCTTMSSPFSHY